MALGAAIFAGVYTLVTVTFGPAKEYNNRIQLYIDFAYDEDAGSMVDHYNAFTWNDLMSSDAIANGLMDSLSEEGAEDITRDEALSSIKAEIPSDVRLLIVTVTSNTSDKTDTISDAIVKSLESYGNTNEAFDSIKKIGQSGAVLVTYTDRTLVAAIFGAVLAGIIILFVLLLLDALDSAVYVPEECEERYKHPVLGVLPEKSTTSTTDDFFKNELLAACEHKLEGAEHILFISADSVEGIEKSKEDYEHFKEVVGGRFEQCIEKVTPIEAPGSVLENYRKIGTSDGVIIAVPYGKRNGAMTSHIIAQLKKHDCKILGLVLVRADYKFLKRYYGLK